MENYQEAGEDKIPMVDRKEYYHSLNLDIKSDGISSNLSLTNVASLIFQKQCRDAQIKQSDGIRSKNSLPELALFGNVMNKITYTIFDSLQMNATSTVQGPKL